MRGFSLSTSTSVIASLAAWPLLHARELSTLIDPKTVLVKDKPLFETTAVPCPPVDVDYLLKMGFLKSQDGEDQCMMQVFRGLCGGKYMEMGALDGYKFSNTYGFYVGAAWTGVNVELVPEAYRQLVKNRPNDIANVNAAVCSEPSTLHYIGSINGAVGGIWEFFSEAHRNKHFKGVKLENTIPIPCTPLQNILNKELGTEKILFDFFSLDLEGAEMSALRGIDFEQTGFGVLIVEKQNVEEEDKEIQDFLMERGYHRFQEKGCRNRRNFMYKNQDFDRIYNQVRFATPMLQTEV